MTADIAYRQRRYLIMMSIRAVCFVIAILFFVNHLGWLTAIPAVGAITIPYFAVVFANGGREPSTPGGFRPYEPSLPAPYSGPRQARVPGAAGPGTPAPGGTPAPADRPVGLAADQRTPGANGAPPHNA